MQKYNFHEIREAIKKNPRLVLPEDINDPIVKWLESIQCGIGAKQVLKKQKNLGFGTLEFIHEASPNAKITIQIDAGMVGEVKKWVQTKEGPWTIIDTTTIKNANLDKRKPKESKDAGKHG